MAEEQRPAVPGASPREAAPSPAAAPPQRIASERLFGGASELLIEHRGAVYRLRRTALGKLILTK